MPRIAGIDIPENKRIDIALTHIYGVGRKNVVKILASAKVDSAKRAKTLTEEEVMAIQQVVENGYTVEGGLRKTVQDNIKRLKLIGSYRGKRHIANLPSRGQRTRSNARTKRGKRVTIGALKKEELVKKQQTDIDKTKTPVATK